MEYRAIDVIKEGDYIYVHHDGKVFNGNNYPFNLRDGIAKRDLAVGGIIAFNKTKETEDIIPKPSIPDITTTRLKFKKSLR
jgi:hypothetical protein